MLVFYPDEWEGMQHKLSQTEKDSLDTLASTAGFDPKIPMWSIKLDRLQMRPGDLVLAPREYFEPLPEG